jgi:URI fold toxin 2
MSTKTYVYRVLDKQGNPHKIGESAQGVRKTDGKSIRAEQQARKLKKETGKDFETDIIKTFDSKKEAYQYENKLIKELRKDGVQLPGNKTNH